MFKYVAPACYISIGVLILLLLLCCLCHWYLYTKKCGISGLLIVPVYVVLAVATVLSNYAILSIENTKHSFLNSTDTIVETKLDTKTLSNLKDGFRDFESGELINLPEDRFLEFKKSNKDCLGLIKHGEVIYRCIQ